MGAEVVIAAATSAQAGVLLLAALYAKGQLDEARRLRAAQVRPFVVVDFSFEQTIIFLTVANIGPTLARNVTLTFTPELSSTLDKTPPRLSDLKMLTDGIPSLAPGKTLSTVFDSFPARHGAGLDQSYDVTIRYQGEPLGETYTDETTLDLGIYINLTRVDRHGLHDIHKQIEKIAKEVPKWTSPFGRGLLTRSTEDIERFQNELEKRREQKEQKEKE
jgi:hypothetical protein